MHTVNIGCYGNGDDVVGAVLTVPIPYPQTGAPAVLWEQQRHLACVVLQSCYPGAEEAPQTDHHVGGGWQKTTTPCGHGTGYE